jgi:CRISPR-associated protein Cas5
MKIDISLLFKKPELDGSVMLIIQPLAPLSMVSSLPGSYYKTERIPTKFMLSGLFENLLGWHFSKEDRAKIFKEMKKLHKKKFKQELEKEESEVGYQSLVGYYFETAPPPFVPVLQHYEDLWTQHLIGSDQRHADGAINYDWRLEKERNIIKAKIKSKELTENDFGKFFMDNRAQFPLYYRSVPKREFVIAKGFYQFRLNINRQLLDLLQNACFNMNIGYLGTSEGWVDVDFREGITNG